MFDRTKTLAAAYVAIAGLATLLNSPVASAQERITLETIGAVRMARAEEVRSANPEFRPADTAPVREPAGRRTTQAR